MVEDSALAVCRPEKWDWRKAAAFRASTEFDSEGSVLLNKISARILNGFAKLKASFDRRPNGELSPPLLAIATKNVTVLYDCSDQNALVTLTKDLGRNLGISYVRDIKEGQGVVTLQAHNLNADYKAEVSVNVSSSTASLCKGSVLFPLGEVKVEEEMREDEDYEEFRTLAFSGYLGGQVVGGLAVADYRQEGVNLKYRYKDDEMTLTPTIQLSSESLGVAFKPESLGVAFKRQFDQANKISYNFNFSSTEWSAVYKHQPSDAFKLKLGYNSEDKIMWGSAWVGKEEAGAKTAPRKCKLQLMLHVPQENMSSAMLLFRIKKRWDL